MKGRVPTSRAMRLRWERVCRAAIRAKFRVPRMTLRLWRSVRDSAGRECHGITTGKNGRFTIDLDVASANTEVLVHEIAHAIAFQADESCHGAVWAVVYGALYRRVI